MNINATLVAQVVNFFIAYVLFRFILLKPAYSAIQEEQEAKTSLEQLVSDDTRYLEERRQKIADQWQESYVFFKKYLPKTFDKHLLVKDSSPPIQLKERNMLDATTKQAMKERLSRVIVKRVGGYYDNR